MNKNIIFKNEFSTETVFFFGKVKIGEDNLLFRDAYIYGSGILKEKKIIVEKNLSDNLPDYCFLKLNHLIEKDDCYIAKNVLLITPTTITEKDLSIRTLVKTGRNSCVVKDSVKYYDAKTILGDIECLIAKFNINGWKGLYHRCYLHYAGMIFEVEDSSYIHKKSDNTEKDIDYSLSDFKDFHEIKK